MKGEKVNQVENDRQPTADASPALARFFVALLPPPDLQHEITAIKQDIGQRFGSKAALKAPPHITLQPPFQWSEARMGELDQALADFAQRRSPMPIQLKNFSAFAPRVIYIDVVQTTELMATQPVLMAHLKERCGIFDRLSQTRPFKPHLTVGFRDLKPAAFRLAWAEFEHRPFAAAWVVQTLTLLRHDGQQWQCLADFPLSSSIP